MNGGDGPGRGISVEETIEALTALQRQTLNVWVERRPKRAEGQPTRLQLHVLLAVRQRGALQVSEVAALLEIAPATTSQLLSAMEEKGWLQREILPRDRRRHQVSLTAAGRDLLDRLESRRRNAFAPLLAEMTAEERADLVAMARRVVDMLRRMDPETGREGV